MMALTAKLALDWISRDHRCRLIVNEELYILWANAPARAQLKNKRYLLDRNGFLIAKTASLHEPLAAFVRNCQEKPETVLLTSKTCELLLQAVCLARADGGRSYVGISFLLEPEVQWPIHGFGEAFRLTPSELKVLQQLLTGRSAAEISECMNVSVETTRSHIRHIYEKVDVSSRESLFSRLAPFAVL